MKKPFKPKVVKRRLKELIDRATLKQITSPFRGLYVALKNLIENMDDELCFTRFSRTISSDLRKGIRRIELFNR